MGKTHKETPTELVSKVISAAPVEKTRKERSDHVGLRGLRKNPRGPLLPPCPSCRMRRYSECGCMKKAVVE